MSIIPIAAIKPLAALSIIPVISFPLVSNLLTKTTQQIAALTSAATVRIDNGDALGSGFLITKDGYIITADHVVAQDDPKKPNKIMVTFRGQAPEEAVVVGEDKMADDALLKVAIVPRGALPLSFNLTSPTTGDDVIEVGMPFDTPWTVTKGIVSNPRYKNTDDVITYMQYDAPTNPGNSGGPVVDKNGALLGMADQIKAAQNMFGNAQNAGLAFAVPSRILRVSIDRIAVINELTL